METVDRPAAPSENLTSSRDGSRTGGSGVDASSPSPEGTVRQRAVAYIRESTEEQGQGFSPDAQRETIRKFAAENDLELIGEYCDFHSGWRKSEARPEFQRLMADAAAGAFDCVLVFHTSRFARSQVEARRYKQLLRERLGIRVVSVTQPMGEDPTDPSAFLAESIHEMFDEYYSVSLSFWTRSGLREKARQGHLVGSLPWGYVRDPERQARHPRSAARPAGAGAVRALRNRPGVRPQSRRLAERQGARAPPATARSARTLFARCSATPPTAGYVCGLRDKTRSIRGLHEAIVTDELFDRVQEVRSWRTRVLKPGRPSEEYLLRKLLVLRALRRAHARHSRLARRHPPLPMLDPPPPRRLPTRPIVKAEPLEEQLIDWLHAFQPDAKLRKLVLDTITRRHPRPSRQRRSGAPPRAADPARPPPRPLRPRRPHQAPLRHAPPNPRGRAATPRAARRPPTRPSPGTTRRLRRASGVQSPTQPSAASSSPASSTTSGKTTAPSSPSSPARPSPRTSRRSTKPARHPQKQAREAG